jgi:hypothetical protein
MEAADAAVRVRRGVSFMVFVCCFGCAYCSITYFITKSCLCVCYYFVLWLVIMVGFCILLDCWIVGG